MELGRAPEVEAGAEVEEEVAAEAALQPEEEPARAEEEGSPSRDREEPREGEDVPDVVANPQVWDDHVAPDRAVHVDHDPDVQDRVVQEDREAAVAVAAGRDDRGLGSKDDGRVKAKWKEGRKKKTPFKKSEGIDYERQ
ncbi:hypothetical protein ANCCEY_02572 [Ancylostoma ceylanicum]|uniref:Uncharacterized protein n=1 Tax=Ancylostoma ceylanicum TaxID=53326 RepID=A0A0D6MC59_9BILA|nr:hypothetical protein ANCCEY_02572 [Ancylostoma ceylanicum]